MVTPTINNRHSGDALCDGSDLNVDPLCLREVVIDGGEERLAHMQG